MCSRWSGDVYQRNDYLYERVEIRHRRGQTPEPPHQTASCKRASAGDNLTDKSCRRCRKQPVLHWEGIRSPHIRKLQARYAQYNKLQSNRSYDHNWLQVTVLTPLLANEQSVTQ